MKAIVLAAGYATRLYPLTLNQPKHLLEVGGRPILERLLGQLAEIEGLDHVYVVTNAKFAERFREFVEEFELEDGKRLFLIAEGRLVNLSSAEGHPAAVMDMSFANQALSAEYVVTNAANLERQVYPVPSEIDSEIARLKLATMGIEIDTLTEEQAKYLASWDEGT